MYNMHRHNFAWKRSCCNFKIHVHGSGVGSKLEVGARLTVYQTFLISFKKWLNGYRYDYV